MDARIPREDFGDPGRHLREARGAGGVVKVCVARLAPVDQRNYGAGADEFT